MKVCANCGREIEGDESYHKFLDYFFQAKFFESDKDNIFAVQNVPVRL